MLVEAGLAPQHQKRRGEGQEGGHNNLHYKDQASWTILDLVNTLARVTTTGAMGRGSMEGGVQHTHSTRPPDIQKTSDTGPGLLTGAVGRSIRKGQ